MKGKWTSNQDSAHGDSARGQSRNSGDGASERTSFDRQLDRLVDGELPSTEYREFVKRLEEHPDGWRRCALAFLESQAWSREISAVQAAPSAELPVATRRGPDWVRAACRWSAIAASWLGALGIGVWWSSPGRLGPPPLPRSVMETVTARSPVANPSARPQLGHPSLVGSAHLPPGGMINHRGGDGEVEFVMTREDGDYPTTTRLPLRSFDQQRPDAEASDDDMSEPAIVELLRRTGHEVKREQEMVPFELPDGRQVLMPVDKLLVKTVRMPAY